MITTADLTATQLKTMADQFGMGLFYSHDSDILGASMYRLFAMDPDGQPFHVADVTVDLTTRAIGLHTPDGLRTLTTQGLASWTFDGDTKRISGVSVAQYVVPRLPVLLARLFAMGA